MLKIPTDDLSAETSTVGTDRPPASDSCAPVRFAMRPSAPPLTLMVASATVPPRGIGLGGTLPWPMLKTDMSFFARVTRRVPSPRCSAPGTSTIGATRMNAVLMGRKTYISIPAHLRPLKGRINVVITRQEPDVLQREMQTEVKEVARTRQETGKKQLAGEAETVHVASSLPSALQLLQESYGDNLGGLFVIGGAEVYRSALESRESDLKVVMTQVRREDNQAFDCDTFFPVDLEHRQDEWRQMDAYELTELVGEPITEEWKREGETNIELRMTGYARPTEVAS